MFHSEFSKTKQKVPHAIPIKRNVLRKQNRNSRSKQVRAGSRDKNKRTTGTCWHAERRHRSLGLAWLSYLTLRKVSDPNIKMQKLLTSVRAPRMRAASPRAPPHAKRSLSIVLHVNMSRRYDMRQNSRTLCFASG